MTNQTPCCEKCADHEYKSMTGKVGGICRNRFCPCHTTPTNQEGGYKPALLRLLFGSETAKPNKTFIALEIFIDNLLAEERRKIAEEVEKLQKDCGHDSRSHCLENKCYVHEPNGYHEAIFDVVRLLDKPTNGV